MSNPHDPFGRRPRCKCGVLLGLSTSCPDCGALPKVDKCPKCKGYPFRMTACGVRVCFDCDYHEGLARCFCGWAADGGDGRQQLVEAGEVIDEDY